MRGFECPVGPRDNRGAPNGSADRPVKPRASIDPRARDRESRIVAGVPSGAQQPAAGPGPGMAARGRQRAALHPNIAYRRHKARSPGALVHRGPYLHREP